ncbi:MAG: HD domain-containing protein [Eubacterium sp.]|jgi:3'-5' exoribonuclease|nr:HD domain-containing protein [Eubacterium sp.]
MKYIETLREGERIQEIYLCKQKTSAMTKTGKEYENVILQDKTGQLDAKIWDPGSMGIEDFEALDYVEVHGDVTVFNGQTQLSIKRARKISEDSVDPSNYLPCTDKNMDEMMTELLKFIASVNNPFYKQVLTVLFIDDSKFAEAFKKHSAAKSVHHGFIGGLLEHTLAVTKLCDFYTKQYPILNRDLLLTAAICHDIGKVYELSDFPANDYTDAGQLLGHIVMGSEMVSKIIATIPDFPKKQANELKHCILAHHGELEYGSPKKPALIEALALNFADNTDAKMETMKEIFDSNSMAGAGEWLGYNRLLESNIRRTTE